MCTWKAASVMSSDEEDYGLDETDSGNESPDDEDVENDDFVMDIGLGKELKNRRLFHKNRTSGETSKWAFLKDCPHFYQSM